MFEIKNVCLILQGYSFSKEQLLKDIKKYYLEDNIKNIVISSYSNLIDNELHKYAKIINNDQIGNIILKGNKDNINKTVVLKYSKEDYIKNLDIENFNIDNARGTYLQYDKGLFRICLTTKRGINTAKQYFPNCTHYFILRADMTINNLQYILNKWKSIPRNINNDLFKEKIIFKSSDKHKQIYNICDYLSFGNKQDIENLYIIKEAFLPQSFETGMFERGLFRSYIYSINNKLSNEYIYNNFYYHENELNIDWYKYNKYGTWQDR